jgi:hypothetical protein
MITALDSSVLWAILKKEPGYEPWLQTLLRAASEGPLLISPIAFAELAPSTADAPSLTAFLGQLSITYNPITPSAAHLAGLTFKRYRASGNQWCHGNQWCQASSRRNYVSAIIGYEHFGLPKDFAKSA